MITSFVESDHQTWDDHLPELVFAYNSAKHQSTGESPAMLNMARRPLCRSALRQDLEKSTLQQCEAEALKEWKSKIERIDLLHTEAA